MIRLDELARIAVVGTSCAGKTTLAHALAERLNVAHIELDGVYWGPEWTPVAADQFRQAVDRLTAEPRWVCDGNFETVRDLVWQRATAIVWLNYSFSRVFGRGLRRTVGRCILRTPLFAGNRESFRQSFFSRDSILLWILKTHRRRQREYPCLLAEPRHSHLRMVELRCGADAEEFLRDVAAALSAGAVTC
jgi:adenylate kinase family enzyme